MEDKAREIDSETLIRADRVAEIRRAYAAIAEQIAALRELDLGDAHPAVVFRPLRRGEGA
ncbi:hypothetical protein [Aurantimonas marina]|uniref:hypothetical protein n=1 Tax=Aurantimonas marina TaxID=2780508 RepID=UPI0019D0F975|nr:hypothetical protein [Aurantimonas marina]